MHVLDSNETWGTVVADLLRRSELTPMDISILIAILTDKLKGNYSESTNEQHRKIIEELEIISALIRAHFRGL